MTSPYEKALELGYTDDQIVEHISKKDHNFSKKYKRARELGYKPKDIFTKYNQSKKIDSVQEKELQISDYAKDISQQAAKGFTIGSIGTYGDILDMFGLQTNKTLPGEKARSQLEAEAKPEELPGLVEGDDIIPRYSKLPSSQETEKFLGMMGLAPEAKTSLGKYGERAGKLAGSFLSTGTPTLKAPLVAAGAGQILEELGAPPWMQAAGEIIATLKTMPKGNIEISSKSPEIQNSLNRLRKLGFTEKDITLAKNSLEDRGLLKKIAKMTDETKERFANSIKSTEDNFNKILENSFEGITKEGPEIFKKASSDLFESLEETAKQIKIKDPEYFVKNAEKAIADLERTLANTPQEKQVIDLLKTSIDKSKSKGGVAADFYTNFYKGLNAIGRWENPKQREHVFGLVKNAIKDTFRKQGPEGAQLANQLEEANKSWMKYLKAEDVSNVINKSMTEDGLNFSKLSKSLETKSNFDTLVEGLGKKQASNLKFIADTGKNIKNLDKAITGDEAKKIFGSIKLWETAKALITLDVPKIGALLGHEIAGNVATKVLTDPKYQNVLIKMTQAAKDSKWNQLAILSRNLENKITKEEGQNRPK